MISTRSGWTRSNKDVSPQHETFERPRKVQLLVSSRSTLLDLLWRIKSTVLSSWRSILSESARITHTRRSSLMKLTREILRFKMRFQMKLYRMMMRVSKLVWIMMWRHDFCHKVVLTPDKLVHLSSLRHSSRIKWSHQGDTVFCITVFISW